MCLYFLLLLSTVICLRMHDFYALEDTKVVSNSNSIKMLNKCKDKCLKMKQYFPYYFKVSYLAMLVPPIYFEGINRELKVFLREMLIPGQWIVEIVGSAIILYQYESPVYRHELAATLGKLSRLMLKSYFLNRSENPFCSGFQSSSLKFLILWRWRICQFGTIWRPKCSSCRYIKKILIWDSFAYSKFS